MIHKVIEQWHAHMRGELANGLDVLLDDDVDGHGKPWGHDWMQPEPQNEMDGADHKAKDARPDWEQEKDEETRIALAVEPTDLLSDDHANEEGVNEHPFV